MANTYHKLFSELSTNLPTYVGGYSQDMLMQIMTNLVNDIKKGFASYLSSYTPSLYKRNGVSALQSFLTLDSLEVLPPNAEGQQEFLIRFNSSAVHQNMTQDHYSYIPLLFEYGWKTKMYDRAINNGASSDAYLNHFASFKGVHVIEDTIRKYRAMYPELVFLFIHDGYKV